MVFEVGTATMMSAVGATKEPTANSKGLHLGSFDQIRRIIDEKLEAIWAGDKPRQLSGGQRQRHAMGRAIVREPAVSLFDEPLSNLDAKLRVQMRLEIRELQAKLGITSLYVTHDQVEAMTMADRMIVMNGGVAEQIGTPLEVYPPPARSSPHAGQFHIFDPATGLRLSSRCPTVHLTRQIAYSPF